MAAPRSRERRIELSDEHLCRLLVMAQASQARQGHGFIFQSGIAKLLKLYVPASYTDEVDAYSITQPHDDVMRHSFKTANRRQQKIDLGDLERNGLVQHDFILYVGFWRGFSLNIREICVMYVRAAYWRSQFPDDISPFMKKAVFEGITNDKECDAAWQERRRRLQAKWAEEVPRQSFIHVNFKRDHKKQQRVQCSIPGAGFPRLFHDCYDEARTRELEAAFSA